MPEIENSRVSRRQFLKNAGIIVGGTAVGSSFILSACKDGGEVTKEVTKTVQVTTVKATFVCPICSQEFESITALSSHLESAHPGEVETITKFVCPFDNAEFGSLSELKTHIETAHLTAAPLDPSAVTLNINGVNYLVKADAHETLAYTLKEQLGLTGTKIGCDMGQCGACTVLADGIAIYSCLKLTRESEGIQIETVEGLADGHKLSPLQRKFQEIEAVQCGYCTPGFLMAAKGLLRENSNPSEDEVRLALSGHICSCQNFKKTIAAVVGGV
ncbi:MAG: 2Fe-2S iron-sulfur cluster-binding protein [Dehalococcoidales bacterium]|jgi:carbon-monoxide dehydrogenase small subunit|nr:2Fe-2S iron-sulfur cluster-binding protein [Dehalococcoidales bacterium]